jgi:RHS repeat-associated protein
LFTGQRLDGTGLYYYNARYYDPTIGRFISPDTVVQSPANPQTLNRYSYCLNNPLKYTDPSGRIVTFFGIDISYAMATGDYSSLLSVGSSTEYSAYMEFRSIDPILTRTLETSDRRIDISFGDTSIEGSPFTPPDSTFTRNGDNRNIVINNSNRDADSSWLAGQIYEQSTNFVDIYAPLINQETMYDVFSLIPAGRALGLFGKCAGDIGKGYEAFKGALDFSESFYNRDHGASGWDRFISGVTTIFGFSPWWLPAGLFQLGWDINKAGVQWAEGIKGKVYQFIP